MLPDERDIRTIVAQKSRCNRQRVIRTLEGTNRDPAVRRSISFDRLLLHGWISLLMEIVIRLYASSGVEGTLQTSKNHNGLFVESTSTPPWDQRAPGCSLGAGGRIWPSLAPDKCPSWAAPVERNRLPLLPSSHRANRIDQAPCQYPAAANSRQKEVLKVQEVREGAEPGWAGRYDSKMRAGMVYAMTNAAAGNEVIAFRRANDGTLTRMNAYPTGGKGTGTMKVSPATPQNGIDPLTSQGSLSFSRDGRFLFAVNAGSDSITSFRVAD